MDAALGNAIILGLGYSGFSTQPGPNFSSRNSRMLLGAETWVPTKGIRVKGFRNASWNSRSCL